MPAAPDPDPDVTLVLASYAAYARADIDAAVAPTTEDTVWVEPEEFPLGGRRVGRAAIAEYLSASRAAWRDLDSRPTAHRVGESIVVVHQFSGVLHDGTPAAGKVADVFRVQDGTVVSMHATLDIATALSG